MQKARTAGLLMLRLPRRGSSSGLARSASSARRQQYGGLHMLAITDRADHPALGLA